MTTSSNDNLASYGAVRSSSCRPRAPKTFRLLGQVALIALPLVLSGYCERRVAGQTTGRESNALTWYQAYEVGVEAFRRGDLSSAIAHLELAKARGPTPGRSVRFYGKEVREFIPDYFLGLAFFNLRRFNEANAAFDRVQQAGLIRPSDPEYPVILETRRRIAVENSSAQQGRQGQQGQQGQRGSTGSPGPRPERPPIDREPPIPAHPRPSPDPSLPTGRPSVKPGAVNLDEFRRYSKQMVDGVVGFDYPPRMTMGDRTDVRLRVSMQKTVQELRDALTRNGRDPIVESAKVSPKMKAELQGFGFEVKSLSSVEQIIDADEDTTWTWDVRATEAGKQRLTVTLTAIIEVEDSEGSRDVSSFYREVEVVAIPKTLLESTREVVMEYGPSRDAVWPAIPTIAVAVWAFLFRNGRSETGGAGGSKAFRHGSLDYPLSGA